MEICSVTGPCDLMSFVPSSLQWPTGWEVREPGMKHQAPSSIKVFHFEGACEVSFVFWKTVFHSGPWRDSNPGPSYPEKLPPFWAGCREFWNAQVLLHLLKAWPSLVHLPSLLSINCLIVGFWLKFYTIWKKWTQTSTTSFAGREGCLDDKIIKQAPVVTKTKEIMKLPQGLENLQVLGYFPLVCPL